MNAASTDSIPIQRLLFRMEESVKIMIANIAKSNNAYGQISELSNTNTTPRVNTAGSRCTTFSDSGYFLYRLIRVGKQSATVSSFEDAYAQVDIFAEPHFRESS